MKHLDVIAVSLRYPSGQRVKEFNNGGDDEPHPRFEGSIGTRQIAVDEGNEIEVMVELDETFDFYSADGISIEIYTGSPTAPLTIEESGQCWWLGDKAYQRGRVRRAKRAVIVGTHTFSFYTVFHSSKSQTKVPFKAPEGNASKCVYFYEFMTDNSFTQTGYKNASYRWMVGNESPLSKSSLVVYIARSRWYLTRPLTCAMTEPNQGQR